MICPMCTKEITKAVCSPKFVKVNPQGSVEELRRYKDEKTGKAQYRWAQVQGVYWYALVDYIAKCEPCGCQVSESLLRGREADAHMASGTLTSLEDHVKYVRRRR